MTRPLLLLALALALAAVLRRRDERIPPLGHGYSPRPDWAGRCPDPLCGAKPGSDCLQVSHVTHGFDARGEAVCATCGRSPFDAIHRYAWQEDDDGVLPPDPFCATDRVSLSILMESGTVKSVTPSTGPDGKHGDRHTQTCGCDQ